MTYQYVHAFTVGTAPYVVRVGANADGQAFDSGERDQQLKQITAAIPDIAHAHDASILPPILALPFVIWAEFSGYTSKSALRIEQ